MFVNQISVFLENKQGRIEEWTSLLGKNGIDLIALSIADTTNFGILRAIVNDNDKAMELMQKSGYTAKLVDVLAVAVPDTPGGLASVLRMLKDANISVEYLYSFVRLVDKDAIIIFRVDNQHKAMQILKDNNVRLLSQNEIAKASV